jgi:hypothetical protein
MHPVKISETSSSIDRDLPETLLNIHKILSAFVYQNPSKLFSRLYSRSFMIHAKQFPALLRPHKPSIVSLPSDHSDRLILALNYTALSSLLFTELHPGKNQKLQNASAPPKGDTDSLQLSMTLFSELSLGVGEFLMTVQMLLSAPSTHFFDNTRTISCFRTATFRSTSDGAHVFHSLWSPLERWSGNYLSSELEQLLATVSGTW